MGSERSDDHDALRHPRRRKTNRLRFLTIIAGLAALALVLVDGVPTAARAIAALALSVGVLATATIFLRMIWLGESTAPATKVPARRLSVSTRSRTGVLTVVAVVVLTGGISSALFTSSDSIDNNLFGTGCFDAQVSGVQSGEVTNSAEGTQTVPITSVDPTQSIAFISVRSNSNRPADSMILAELVSSTALELTRRTDAGSPPAIVVQWTVVTYGCGVTVQRGTTPGNGTATLDVTIGSVDTAAAFIVTSSVTDRADAAHDGDDDHLVQFNNSTTARFTAAAGGVLPADHLYGWQVVSFDDPGDVQIQNDTLTLAATNSETITLSTAAGPETTLVLAHAASAGSGSDIGERLARVHLSSANTVEVTRLAAGEPVEVSVQVITFLEGTTVQHGIVNLAAADSQETVSVNPVDTGRSSALSTVAGPGSFSGGATDMVASASLGEASATFAVTDPTTVSITRAATTAAASFGWQLIEWGGPSWWDTDYPFRRRVEVATSSTEAPDAYAVPVTIDHLSMVNDGLSQPNGDDLRLLRWDGAAWIELDRVLDDGAVWGDASTTFWFRTTAAIAASSTDSYWIYFGDDTPTAPPADPEQVWLLHEDFESGTLGDFEDRTSGIAWYRAEPWTSRISIAVQASQVDSNLTDFPVLVELVNASLGSAAQPDGSDIRFTAADGVTPLSHEIESWNPGTGALSAWVLIPNLSASADTNFLLYYGASDAPGQDDPTTVWGAANGVWHMHRDPSGATPQADDSSAARHDGVSSGAMSTADLVSGRAGSAVDYDGLDDRLDIEPFDITGKTLTASGWVRLDSVAGDQLIIGKANDAADRVLTLGTSGTQARFELTLGATTYSTQGGVLATGSWHHLAATWNGVTMELFVDGFSVSTTSASGSVGQNSTMAVSLGSMASGQQALDGLIDEVRLEAVVRSDQWLVAAVRNQSNPGTFVTVGAPQTGTWLDQGDWSYRKPISVGAAAVDADLTDQPVLVQLTDTELVGKLQADGDDLIFTAADGVTRLDHELEAIDSASGAVTAWVRVPLLTAATATELFVYYGNPSGVNQQDSEGVFGPDADLVFHGS